MDGLGIFCASWESVGLDPHQSWEWVWCSGWFKSSSGCLTDDSKTVFLLCMLIVICVWLCHTAMSVSCSLVVTCWERADPWLSCM